MAGVLLLGVAWVALRHGRTSPEAGLPQLGHVPEFVLTSSDGRPLSQADLAGNIWIADFIFTRCGGLCPTLSAQMARLQSALAREGMPAVRLISFSVDPVNDTPAVLREYAQRCHADPARWSFLTGDHEAMYQLIGQGFHLAVAERPPTESSDVNELITHSDRFVLVDRNLDIRGYYHGTDEDGMKQLLTDLKSLHGRS